MRTLFISHGDKGGVGKSMTSAVLVERLLDDQHAESIAIIEGDKANPDVGKRYQHVAGVVTGVLPLNQPGMAANDAVTQLADWIEHNEPDAVVVNLPANASETLDQCGTLLRSVCNALGYRMVVTYSLGIGDDLTVGMIKSLESGLLSQADPSNRYVIYPIFQGAKARFLWSRHPAREDYLMQEIEMPALMSSNSRDKLTNTAGRITDLGETGGAGWTVAERINVGEWIYAATTAIDALMIEDARP